MPAPKSSSARTSPARVEEHRRRRPISPFGEHHERARRPDRGAHQPRAETARSDDDQPRPDPGHARRGGRARAADALGRERARLQSSSSAGVSRPTTCSPTSSACCSDAGGLTRRRSCRGSPTRSRARAKQRRSCQAHRFRRAGAADPRLRRPDRASGDRTAEGPHPRRAASGPRLRAPSRQPQVRARRDRARAQGLALPAGALAAPQRSPRSSSSTPNRSCSPVSSPSSSSGESRWPSRHSARSVSPAARYSNQAGPKRSRRNARRCVSSAQARR